MPNFKRVIDLAYFDFLGRAPNSAEISSGNVRLNSGETEASFRESVIRSEEYAQNNPDPTPIPPDPIPPGGGIKELRLDNNPHCLILNGSHYTIASHGNIVTAFPNHNWEDDLRLQLEHGESYARLWHILASETVEWPWLKVGSKWDLSRWNETYWNTIRTVLDRANKAGVIVEPHIFDRGCGGSQRDYRNYPWHPDNNINALHDQLPVNGTGFPPFYEAAKGTNLYNLQAAYVQRWTEECHPFPGTILEIENEHRAGGGNNWFRQWARLIKVLNPRQLVSYSSLEEDLEAAYDEQAIDIVNKHFGDSGEDPRIVHSYIAAHWKKNKLINIDEFANGMADPVRLREICETITKAGAHFHIEDSLPSAKGYEASAYCRNLIAKKNPPYCSEGPIGPAPPCPKETKRGWSILYINRKGKRLFTGNAACMKAAKDGLVKPGDNIVFDSTALVATQEPVPDGCGTCVENPTVWSHTMGGREKIDGPCGFEIWPEHSGTVTSRPKNGPGQAVTKQIKIVP